MTTDNITTLTVPDPFDTDSELYRFTRPIWTLLAGFAWRMYTQYGLKGAVFVDFDRPHREAEGGTVDIDHHPAALDYHVAHQLTGLAAVDGMDISALQNVQGDIEIYDPERDVVVVVVFPGGQAMGGLVSILPQPSSTAEKRSAA